MPVICMHSWILNALVYLVRASRCIDERFSTHAHRCTLPLGALFGVLSLARAFDTFVLTDCSIFKCLQPSFLISFLSVHLQCLLSFHCVLHEKLQNLIIFTMLSASVPMLTIERAKKLLQLRQLRKKKK